MKNHKSFYIWLVTNLVVISGIYWAGHSGVIEKIWNDDVTMITSILAILFFMSSIAIGYIAYTKNYEHKLVDTCWFASEQMLALGMLGTVVGFIYLLSSGITSASVTDPTSLATLLGNMSVGLGIALYTNAVGILSSLITKGMLYAVTYEHEE